MARSYGVLKISVWEPQSDFRTLSPLAQWAYTMLISQPQINNLGVLPYTPEKWRRLAAGLQLVDLEQAIEELRASTFVLVDLDAGELLVRTFIKHDKVWSQPKLVTNARKLIREVESEQIRGYLVERHPWLVDKWDRPEIEKHEERLEAVLSEGVSKGVSEPLSEGVSEGVSIPISPPRARPGPGPGAGVGSISEEAQGQQQQHARENAAAAARLSLRLEELKIRKPERDQALADPERATAWLDLAAVEARQNPAGFYRTGFASGDWPSPRIPTAEPSAAKSRYDQKLELLRNLIELNADEEELRALIDDDPDQLSERERSDLHQHVDAWKTGTASDEEDPEPEIRPSPASAGTR